MKKEKTIYIGENSRVRDLVFELSKAYGEKVSPVIETAADRYLAMVDWAVPEMSEGDWFACLEVCKDIDKTLAKQAVRTLAGVMHVMFKVEKYDKSLGSSPDLPAIISDMPKIQRLAIIHISQKYWANGGRPTRQALLEAGAKIK